MINCPNSIPILKANKDVIKFLKFNANNALANPNPCIKPKIKVNNQRYLVNIGNKLFKATNIIDSKMVNSTHLLGRLMMLNIASAKVIEWAIVKVVTIIATSLKANLKLFINTIGNIN